ncbi:MAG: segregation/condensation protein A [Firmicutes bacterium]|nr:segregation/condensation protein A [Bacillota bacterium]
MSYKVTLRQFEGPFDLLVYLIEHSRMSIYDIRISEITAQYLEYVGEMKRRDIAVAQEFMVLAAELIEIKSRMLLPQQAAAEEEAAEDPRSDLVRRLLEYRQYKEIASFLADQEEVTSHIHAKPCEDISEYTDNPDELLKAGMDQFVNAFREFLFRRRKIAEVRRNYELSQRRRMTIETRIGQIRDFFKKKKSLLFSEMVKDDDSRQGRVITFISILELIRQRTVKAEQKKRFGDIRVTLRTGEKDV